MADNQSFLGRGWSFPPQFNNETGGVEMVSDYEDIEQSLDILLSTSLGERVMQPKYGSNLHDFQFEAMNDTFLGFLRDLVEKAILYYEPRIVTERVEITPDGQFDALEGRLIISIDYFVATTNSRYNYVYDYYLREADRPDKFLS